MKIAAVLTLALSLASAAIIPRMPQDTKTNTKDAAKAGSIKKVGGPSGATINWKATGSVLKKTSFKNSGLKCTDPSLDNLRKAWDKTNVPEYLKDWFAGFQDKNKSFGGMCSKLLLLP